MKVLKIIGWILVGLVCITLMYGIAFGTGVIDLKFKKFFGVQNATIDREIFKESKSYVEGAINDLSNYKLEITTEKDSVAKQAIAQLIQTKFGNLNINDLENEDLKTFLKDVRQGKYNLGGVYNNVQK